MSADIENYVGGRPVVVLATDGTKLYGLLCDTSGRLRVVAGSAGVPADAATETTLDAIKTAVEIIDGGMGLGTETTLNAIKTAAEIIDGFANPLNTLFGYQDRYFEQDTEDTTETGIVTKTLSTVQDGEIWVIQSIWGQNDDQAARVLFELYDGANYIRIHDVTQTGVGHAVRVHGTWVLKKDDRVRVLFVGTVATNTLWWGAWGYKMKI